MFPFELTSLGAEELFRYCNKNPLLEVILIEGLDSVGFQVRVKKDNWFYNTFNLGILFRVEKNKEEINFTLFPDTNLFYELEIKEISKLIEIINLCRDKTEDEIG